MNSIIQTPNNMTFTVIPSRPVKKYRRSIEDVYDILPTQLIFTFDQNISFDDLGSPISKKRNSSYIEKAPKKVSKKYNGKLPRPRVLFSDNEVIKGFVSPLYKIVNISDPTAPMKELIRKKSSSIEDIIEPMKLAFLD